MRSIFDWNNMNRFSRLFCYLIERIWNEKDVTDFCFCCLRFLSEAVSQEIHLTLEDCLFVKYPVPEKGSFVQIMSGL